MCNSKPHFRGFTVWLTGLSGAGKTTLAHMLYRELLKKGLKVELLDSDIIRDHLGRRLGFTKEERDINVKYIGLICELLSRHDVISIVAAISPYRDVREEVKRKIGKVIEVYVKCPMETLIKRKNTFYSKALDGEIKHVAGIDDPYEEPLKPSVIVATDKETPQESLTKILKKLETYGLI